MGGGPAKDHLLCALPFPEPTDQINQLRKKFPEIDITYHQSTESNPDPPASTWSRTTLLSTFATLPADPSTDSPNLSLVHLFSAGSNHIQSQPIYTATDIPITTSSGIHGPQIAEWVVMTALVQTHKYKMLYEMQKKHQWGKVGPRGASLTSFKDVRDMVGRRLGVLGYGSIGRQVGRVAKAMGMDVVAFTATPKDSPEKKRDGGFIVPGTGDPEGEVPSEWYSGLDKESLHHFLKQDIDFLLVSVPLTEQTKHFLGREEFEVLSQGGKKPAFITNIARGPILDQPALVECLKDGTLVGAALDVTDPEPLPEDSELWDMENVVVTPHVSGVGSSYTERAFKVLEENLERRRKGDPLLNVVKRERGY
ncbi:hypothetical protein MBLNU230_g4662t1 [Neophaeotheca triangularis]